MDFNLNQCQCVKHIGGGRIELDIPAVICMCFEYNCPPEIVDAMSTNSQVIDQVTNQIVDGWTDLGSHGLKGFEASIHPLTGIDRSRRLISKQFNAIQAEEIKKLEIALKEKTDEVYKLQEELSQRRANSFLS